MRGEIGAALPFAAVPREKAVSASDILLIQNLLNQYCHAVDRGSVDDILEVFHPDGVLRPVYQGDAAHKGRDAIRAWYQKYDGSVRAGVEQMRHKISAPYIQVDGDRARSVCYLDADFIAKATGEMGVATGRYEDELVRDQGRWWIAERIIIVENNLGLGKPR